jgi:hypothetical protein
MSDTALAVSVVVAILALVGTIGTAILASRQKGLTDLVGALQDEVRSLRETARNNDLRIAKLETRDRNWADYVHMLRAHISDEKPPPPPPWPAGLDR